MKLSRLLFFLFFITVFALFYVYQQSEIFRLAYMGQKRMVVLQVLLDKNTLLRYNKQKSTSLVSIGERVSENKDFQMPSSYRLVKMNVRSRRLGAGAFNTESLFSRIFGVKKQAEAKTINP